MDGDRETSTLYGALVGALAAAVAASEALCDSLRRREPEDALHLLAYACAVQMRDSLRDLAALLERRRHLF